MRSPRPSSVVRRCSVVKARPGTPSSAVWSSPSSTTALACSGCRLTSSTSSPASGSCSLPVSTTSAGAAGQAQGADLQHRLSAFSSLPDPAPICRPLELTTKGCPVPIAVRSSGGSTPADQATVRRLNLALLLRSLSDGGPRPRARLAEDTGLTKATVSSLVAELIDRRLITEGTIDRSGLGRPSRAVELDPSWVRFVGIELQVDYIAGMVLDLTGRVLARRRVPRSMAELGPARALGVVADVARELVAQSGSSVAQVQSLHVAVPGLVDADAGMLSFAPNLHWRDVDIVHTLLGRLGWQDARIEVDNDANMGAVAHYATGRSASKGNLLFIAGAVGVGAGMIVDGRIVRGAAGFAGEVGHMTVGPTDRLCGCGRRGCWETGVGLAALLTNAADAGDPVHDESIDLGGRVTQLTERAG